MSMIDLKETKKLNLPKLTVSSDEISSFKGTVNAAVLGLIFEKLNGYKDGANYTPSVITEYIAKEAVEQAVISAVNSGMGWKCNDLTDIEDKIEKIPTCI